MTEPETRRRTHGDWDGTGRDHTPQKSGWQRIAACLGTGADRRNNLRILAWTFAWAVGYTVAAQALKRNLGGFDLEVGTWRAWGVAMAPNLLAVGVVLAYFRFLRMADELVRLIQLQALALGFGVTFFFLLAWELFEVAGAPTLDPSDAAMVPAFTWMIGSVYFGWRYR